ncbi:MAG: DUF1343 domain-containing protein [Deltaproteobacteria bacterium]|nr:DUF1343 domain-containing protein [Deltaproteobacteria bacterium]
MTCSCKRARPEPQPDAALPIASESASSVASAPPSAPPPAPAAPSRREAPDRIPALDGIDQAVSSAIERGELPGAVVVVVHRDKTVFRKAYGLRAEVPGHEPMTADTLFDLASLTKPVATAASIHLLAERGKLKLTDPVAKYWPEFADKGKQGITVEHLLLHVSGLPASTPLAYNTSDPALLVAPVAALNITDPPGRKLRYSDAGYIALAEVVRRVSGERLDAFFRASFVEPLGMKDTWFNPGRELAVRTAPTERRGDLMLRGQVHDYLASRMGGVAGNAGLFSTADDLARFCRMILAHGELDGRRVLSPDSVREMTRPRAVPGGMRSLGWDVDTGYSGNRGRLFPLGGVGHTGFTGTSIWIDPSSETAVIILASRLHPNGKGDAKRVRAEVATIVGAAVHGPQPGAATLPGIDVLEKNGFQELKGRRVGLVTNPTGVDKKGVPTIDVLKAVPDLTMVALFSPEHGLRGEADAPVADRVDSRTGLPVYSLYGPRKKPAPSQLAGIDTLVYDVQDVGVRFFTYATTLGHLLETAAENKLRIVVLDRPDPSGGTQVEGPLSDAGSESFTCFHSIPIRYGMTPGELATLLNVERKIGAELQVVRLEGWRRGDRFEDTGLKWVRPSPNLPSPAAARLYPGIALIEATNVSVGRGTDHPFEYVGAPWVDGWKLAALLEEAKLPGVHFVPAQFVPQASLYGGHACLGVRIVVVDPETVQPVSVGVEIARQLVRMYPTDWNRELLGGLLANAATVRGIESGEPTASIVAQWQPGLEQFRQVRARHLLY